MSHDEALVYACEGYGCIPADFMFVGISAGRLGALVTKVPLTKDASGRIFQRCLGKLGLSKSDERSIKPDLVNCYLTNLVKGRCLDEKGNNRLPTYEEISFWLAPFRIEVARVQPKRILALGKLVGDKVRFMFPERTRILNHPRFYASHGAINANSSAFKQMLREYTLATTS